MVWNSKLFTTTISSLYSISLLRVILELRWGFTAKFHNNVFMKKKYIWLPFLLSTILSFLFLIFQGVEGARVSFFHFKWHEPSTNKPRNKDYFQFIGDCKIHFHNVTGFCFQMLSDLIRFVLLVRFFFCFLSVGWAWASWITWPAGKLDAF